jgi:hypothetical protein
VIYVTVQRLVRRRPELVWEHLTDVVALPAWAEGVVEATQATKVERGVGLEIDIVRRSGKKRHRATAEVTAWREHELVAVETRAPGILLFHRALLERCPDGTQLGFEAELSLPGGLPAIFDRSPGLLGAPPTPPFQDVYERSIEALVKRIERATEVPYR